jgi:hypothetical protein
MDQVEAQDLKAHLVAQDHLVLKDLQDLLDNQDP